MSSSILYGSLSMQIQVRTSLNREHSKDQHSTAAQSPLLESSKPSTCRSEYVSKEVCTYMHAASRLFFWSMDLLTFVSRLFTPKMLVHLPITTSVCRSDPCFFVSERSGRNRRTGIWNSSTAAVVCTSMYVVVEPRAQQSTAQHSSKVAQSPLHNASKDQVRADQCTYQK